MTTPTPSETPTPTPRTDDRAGHVAKFYSDWVCRVENTVPELFVEADFARELERENQRLQHTIECLRRELADPPGDVQELVIRKLNLVPAEDRDQWKAAFAALCQTCEMISGVPAAHVKEVVAQRLGRNGQD